MIEFKKLHILMLAMVMFALTSPINADVPQTISYQGILTDPGGDPVSDGSYSITFSIYDSPTGGITLWTEAQPVTTSGGAFSVQVGAVNPIVDSVFDSPSRFLGITVGTDPEISPRTHLSSVPYSMRISTIDGAAAGTLSGGLIIEQSAEKQTNASITVMGRANLVDISPSLVKITAPTDSVEIGSASVQVVGPTNSVEIDPSLVQVTAPTELVAISPSLVKITAPTDSVEIGSAGVTVTGPTNSVEIDPSLVQVTAPTESVAISPSLVKITAPTDSVEIGSASVTVTGPTNSVEIDPSLVQVTAPTESVAISPSLVKITAPTDSVEIGSAGVQVVGPTNSVEIDPSLVQVIGATDNLVAIGPSLVKITAPTDSVEIGSVSFTVVSPDGTSMVGPTGVTILDKTGVEALKLSGKGIVKAADAEGTGFLNFVAHDGTRVFSDSAMTSGVILEKGSGSWADLSDRNKKDNLETVNVQDLLEKVAALPVTTWNYKSQDEAIRHIGPMAQDFYAAFGVGTDDKHITTVDADGVSLAAIKALYQKVKELEDVNSQLKTELGSTIQRLDKLQQLIESELAERTSGNSNFTVGQ